MIRRAVANTGEHALRLAELGIAVVPGAYPAAGGCSCRDRTCRAPAAHPADSGWLFHATTDREMVERWWARRPRANVVVPLLGRFHVVEASPAVGRKALGWLPGRDGYAGPVAVAPSGRYHFWVAPGAAVALTVLLGRKGSSLSDVDLRVLREGAYVLAPPSSLGAAGTHRWARPPLAHVRDLPGSAALLRTLCELSDRTAKRPAPIPAGAAA